MNWPSIIQDIIASGPRRRRLQTGAKPDKIHLRAAARRAQNNPAGRLAIACSRCIASVAKRSSRPLHDYRQTHPRQNELISEALCSVAVELCAGSSTPEVLKTFRRALVSELEAVTAETDRRTALSGVRSIDG